MSVKCSSTKQETVVACFSISLEGEHFVELESDDNWYKERKSILFDTKRREYHREGFSVTFLE